jgi:DNA excision repair protein ERCC-8
MNQLLFERASGNIGPNAFARLHLTQLLTSFQPAPKHRFDGGERGTAVHHEADGSSASGSGSHIWAHQAGVNALALERFDGRL